MSNNDGFIEQKSKAVIKEERRLAKITEALNINVLADLSSGKVTLEELGKNSLKELILGPTINVYTDGKFVCTFPKRAFMAVAPRARAALTAEPTLEDVRFPHADPSAVLLILRDIEKFLAQGNSNILISAGLSFEEFVKIYHAGNELGVGHLVNWHRIKISTEISNVLLSYASVDAIVERLPAKDPLFQHLAHDLAFRRFAKRIPDPEVFAEYLEKHKTLKDVMAEVDQKLKAPKKPKGPHVVKQSRNL